MDYVLVSTRQHEGTLLPYLTLYHPEVSVLLRTKFKPLRAGVPEPLQSLCWELSSHWDHNFQLDTSRNLLVAGAVFISSVGTCLSMLTLKGNTSRGGIRFVTSVYMTTPAATSFRQAPYSPHNFRSPLWRSSFSRCITPSVAEPGLWIPHERIRIRDLSFLHGQIRHNGL